MVAPGCAGGAAVGAGTCDRLCKAAAAASIAAVAALAQHSPMTPATLPAQRSRWTTEDVEPRHALAYWVETVCHSFLELDVDSPDRSAFRARLDAVPFGSGSLYLVQANTQYVRRTPRNIARSARASSASGSMAANANWDPATAPSSIARSPTSSTATAPRAAW